MPSDHDIASLYADTPESRTRRLTRPRPRRRRIAGALTVTAMLLSGAAVPVVLHLAGDDSPTLASPASAPSEAPAPANPTIAGMSWHEIQGVAFPVSNSDGPTTFTPTTSAGFSDTDLGAGLAALHIVFRASSAGGPEVFEPALKNQIAGPSAPQLSENVRAEYDEAAATFGLSDGAPLPDGLAEFLGYRVSPLPDGNRAVQIVEQAPDANGVLQPFAFDVVVTRVRESSGAEDWKVVAPTGGGWEQAFSQLASVPGDLTSFEDTAGSVTDRAGGETD